MGCASSKSTPTVEDQIPSSDDVKGNLIQNGRDTLLNVENKIDEMKDSMRETGAKMESALFNSPETERAGNLDDECNESSMAMNGSETTDSDTPNTMTLNMNKPDDDSDGLLTTDKPPTPMPESLSLSDVTLCNDDDESDSSTAEKRPVYRINCDISCDDNESKSSNSEIRSAYGGNCDTLNSNIFTAVCNTAANVAMQDTDTDDCPQSTVYDSDSSRTNSIRSNYSQNSMKTNCQFSGRSSPELNCESESYQNRHRRSTGCSSTGTNCEENYVQMSSDDTYVRLGRQLWNELENNKEMSMAMPCVLQLVKKANAEGRFSTKANTSRTMNINGNLQLKEDTKSTVRSFRSQ